jgi:rubrerythrin
MLLQTELDILKVAILNEEEGYQFYSLAASRAEEPEVAGAFRMLAEEEKQHASSLQKMYREISEGSEMTEDPELSGAPSPGIFRTERAKPESGSLEISVYKIGILMEMASLTFYREAAEKTKLPELKKLFLHLAKWEDSHLESLQKTYDMLRDEWWEKQGFSPA